MYSRNRWEGELIGGINRNKKQMVVQFSFLRFVFFIALLIDKQRGGRRRKKQERKLVYKLFNWFAFALACFFYYLVLYQLIMKLKWHVEKNLKLKSIFRIFRLFFSRLFSCLCTLYTRFHQGGFVFSPIFCFLFTKVETIFVRLESTEGPLRRPLQLCAALTGTA